MTQRWHTSRWRLHAQVSALAAMWLIVGGCASSDLQSTPPINFVEVTERIDTAGQPGRPWLESAAGAGYALVINLAPPDADGSVDDETDILKRSGVQYVNIPVNWSRPTEEDFDRFRATLSASAPKKVLVHCQLNMRASAFTFLYRVIEDNADPETAWEKVTRVWVPEGRWRLFIEDTLIRHDKTFRP